MPLSKLLVAVEGPRGIIKVSGRASFTCSADFKSLVYDLRERGCRRFVLDLTDCIIMDSTFLGILARFAQKLSEPGAGKGTLLLLNPNARIVDLLDNLGVSHLFEVKQGKETPTSLCETVKPSASAQDKEAAARVALEAHQALMEINPANVPKFKEVAQFMAEDLKKLETKKEHPGS